jgi:hypothetical protein
MTPANSETEWVAERLAELEPPSQWHPDARAARERLARRTDRWAPWAIWACRAAASAAVLAIVATVPPVRLAAQRAWDVFFARDISVVQVDFGHVPDAVWAALQPPDAAWQFEGTSISGGLTEASHLAGFDVRTPAPNLVPGSPYLMLVTPMSGELVLKVDALERAARSVGLSDYVVPPEWEGARIRVSSGPAVGATYGARGAAVPREPVVMLVQMKPIAITVPSGFPVQAFAEFALRLFGIDPGEASALAVNAAVAPMAFLGIPNRPHVTVTQVPLRSGGTATMIHHLDDPQDGERVAMIWSRSDRIYMLTGSLTDDVALAVAESLK